MSINLILSDIILIYLRETGKLIKLKLVEKESWLP